MSLPTGSVSLRFQEPSASRSLPGFYRNSSAANCSESSAMVAVQSNGISCGFLKSKSAIVLVRHHPLPRSRNERLAVAVLANRDHAFVGICRQLSRRICRLLPPFARDNAPPSIGICSPQRTPYIRAQNTFSLNPSTFALKLPTANYHPAYS